MGCKGLHPSSEFMKNTRALFLAAGFFTAFFSALAADIGKICDRNGVLLIEISRDAEGGVTKKHPLKAFAAHLLSDLSPGVLPQPGETVYLTLDARAQMAAELALRAIPRGCAILVDPANGDILAMASVPSFDPGAVDEYVLRNDETAPLLNRATSAFAPGATFLPVTALAGLSAGLRSFEHTCTGSLPLDNKVMKCWIADKGGGHGPQTLAAGLKNSCNTFFYSYAIAAGPEKISSIAELLGFGKLSGLPLENEAPGVMGDEKYLAEVSPLEKWSEGYTATMSIGQGMVLTTPLQMASLAATIANGGTVHQLRLVDRVAGPGGTVAGKETITRARLMDAGVSLEDLGVLRDAMFASVNNSGGNAQKGQAPGFRVAGRTGTAQFWRNGKKDNHTAFVGFADSGKYHYAFSVFVQGAKSGGGVAAPLVARILASVEKSDPAPLEPAKGSFDFIEALP